MNIYDVAVIGFLVLHMSILVWMIRQSRPFSTALVMVFFYASILICAVLQGWAKGGGANAFVMLASFFYLLVSSPFVLKIPRKFRSGR